MILLIETILIASAILGRISPLDRSADHHLAAALLDRNLPRRRPFSQPLSGIDQVISPFSVACILLSKLLCVILTIMTPRAVR